MKALNIFLLTSAMCTITITAQAADGTINFTGEIIAASCVASSGAGTSVGGSVGNQGVDVNLGKVSIDSLGGSAGGGIAAGQSINLNLDCGNTAAGLTTVKLGFDPMAGSGIDQKNNSLLKTTGTAQGVGIGMYDSNNNLINLSANEAYSSDLVKSGEDGDAKYTANLTMRAAYVANGDKVSPGTAYGTLPFTLSYE
ncbi:type 1 fimbrial protein [Pseudomonas sp. TNT2022 ID233]|uniref:fimbrial protein n=1 Tax=Pseudomonas aphyarum TaxID=2942629 RepID=UPI00235F5D22|nr:fimbrial protein [Pseudomonas aphyarum]MDD1141017.1 type 1 fimbrial protein [Pseudomonas aphyarum]